MSITRSGTFTSSGSAGGSGTYFYDKNPSGAWGSAGSSGYAGLSFYSNDDFSNGSIFASIDSQISVTFTQEVDNTSVIPYSKDESLSLELQNKKGTIGLTHVVSTTTGDTTNDDNGTRALKLTSVPVSVDGMSGQTANDEFVEMTSMPTTNDSVTYVMTPVANLSSNTTYFLRIDDENLFDNSGSIISYNGEKGFVTDNTKIFITTNDYYSGFKVQVEEVAITSSEIAADLEVNKVFALERTPSPTSFKVTKIVGTEFTYQLEPASYKMNVAFTAANPVILTSINHGLLSDDEITVYDIVSGDSVAKAKYNITKLTSDTFSIAVDGTTSTAGRLNYYRNANKNDTFLFSDGTTNIVETLADGTTQTTTKNKVVRRKIVSNEKKITDNILERDVDFEIIKDSAGSTVLPLGKLITLSGANVNYLPVDASGAITADSIVNNSIVDVTTSESTIRCHISANTNPDHNVHPFHSSAPFVESTFPTDDESFPRNLTITGITRRGHIATVSTNHPHNLSASDYIKIEGSTQSIYNKEVTILSVPSSNTFTYDLDSSSDFTNIRSPAPGNVKLKVSSDEGSTYDKRFNTIFVNFSQSMNTSTITVANNTHLISANGTSATFTGEQDSASSTIQLSDDGFDTIENCVSVTASVGNSVFAILPETLKRNHIYNIKTTTGLQDLGQTNTLYDFTLTDGITTGVKLIDSKTGRATIISKDEDPPEIKKISITSTAGTTGFAGKVLESITASEITSPDDYQAVAINLDTESIKIQFTESMNVSSVTTSKANTDPVGTILLSCDDYKTSVQMSTSPVASSTDEENDTFIFKPVANLSANATYTLKVVKRVEDGSPERNQMLADNVSSVKVITLNTNPSSSYSTGEIISGVRTLTIKANTGTPTIGLTAGDTFFGLTSKGKGKVLDLTSNATNILTVRYTELVSTDGSIKPLAPGEICKVNSTCNFTLDNTAITDPPQGNVMTHDTGNRKIVYRDENLDDEFVSANSSAERIVGRESNAYGFASSSGSEGIVGPGFKVTTTAITANVFFTNTNGDVISTQGSNQNHIDVNKNVSFTFNQTMNTASIDFNAVDDTVRDSYNLLLSYDSSFGNTIPLNSSYNKSNNDTAFEFQPLILSNTSLNLTQNTKIYAKITDGSLKNKGDMNLAADVAFTTYYANTATNVDFKALEAQVFTKNGNIIDLGTGTVGSMPSQTSNADRNTPIIIHFNEVPDLSTFAIGTGNEIQIATASGFASGQWANAELQTSGQFGTQIFISITGTLAASTQYYLKVVTGAGGTNEGGKALTDITYFNSFTTGT